MKQRLAHILWPIVAGLLAASVELHAQQNELPNIVLILADDLGYGDVSAFNKESRLMTQHIDRLAANGVLFTDAHTSASVCTPTRYSIMTGRYNWRSTLKKSVLGGYSKALIEPQRLTVGKMLQQQGYHTAFVGKWHLGWDWHINGEASELNKMAKNQPVDFSKPVLNGPKTRGFSYSYAFSGSLDMPPYVYVENDQPTTAVTRTTVSVDGKGFWREGPTGDDFNHAHVLPHLAEKAVHYIDERAKDKQPFFLYFALPAPHTPILPTSEFMGSSNTNMYGDFVLQVDGVVGQITEALEKHGVHENTMIIFASDNGCSPMANFKELASVGHHPSYIFRGAKADIFEGGHRVPFIVNWPGQIRQPFKTDEIICTTDFMATFAEITSYTLPPDAAEDSYSLLPVILQRSYKKPLREATVHHSNEGRFAIRKGNWKLILWPGSGGWSAPTNDELKGFPEMQLYQLSVDPGEQHNVIASNPDVAKKLIALLTRYVRQGRSVPGPAQENDGNPVWEELAWMK
jgi:arylsulfatase A-like enzyme